MTPLRIAVAGATGRMGIALMRLISEREDFEVTSAFRSARHRDLTGDPAAEGSNVLAGVVSEAALSACDVLIDFSAPEASAALAELAARVGVADVIGTTGFSAEQEERIHTASRNVAIVKSGNMSVGVALLAALVKQASRALPDFDVEILEMHHRAKADAPSGTALLLGRAAADARGIPLAGKNIRTGPRNLAEIGFASLRGGTVVGEHEVIFAGAHERIVLSHVAEDRSIFAQGALVAARWAFGKPPGLYSMPDVLGISA